MRVCVCVPGTTAVYVIQQLLTTTHHPHTVSDGAHTQTNLGPRTRTGGLGNLKIANPGPIVLVLRWNSIRLEMRTKKEKKQAGKIRRRGLACSVHLLVTGSQIDGWICMSSHFITQVKTGAYSLFRTTTGGFFFLFLSFLFRVPPPSESTLRQIRGWLQVT